MIKSKRKVDTIRPKPRKKHTAKKPKRPSYAELRRYRRSKGSSFELTGSVVLRSLEFIDDEAVAHVTEHKITGNHADYPIVTLTTLAKLLDVSYQTVWRWVSCGLIPKPVLSDLSKTRSYDVYHVNEARIIIAVIGSHLNQYKYYTKAHSETKDKLFNQIAALRLHDFTMEDDTNVDQKERPHSARLRKRKAKRNAGK